MHRRFDRFLVTSVAVISSFACATSMSGCLESDVLVNHVLDPSSENVDYSNPNKNYVPDPSAKLTSEQVAATTNASADDIEKVLHDKAVYGTDKVNSKQKAKSGKHSDGSNSPTTAPKQQKAKNGKRVQSSKNNTSNKANGGKTAKTDKNGSSKNQSDGDSDAKATEPGKVYNANGKTANLPTDFKSVCAVGSAATAVISIAGADKLSGSSHDYLTDAGNKKVFGSDALSKATQCWKGAGDKESDVDVKAIVKLKPSAVLIESGSKTLSASSQKRLIEAGISVVPLPQFASDTYIKKAARAIGHLFSEATGGASEQKAEDYVDMVDDVLKNAKGTHGGTVSAYNNIDFDNITDANPQNPSAGSATNWTLFVDAWDNDAQVTASFNGKAIFKQKGVALCRVGWKTRPLSYYLGCGGAVNNAAAYGSYASEGMRLFLTMNENQVSYSWSGLSSDVAVGKDGGTFKQGNTYLLANACDARDSGNAHYLGSKDFNKVIVKTSSIAQKLENARSASLGLYTPGSYRTDTSVTGYGLNRDGKLLRCYSVEPNSARGDVGYSIIVNPCGIIGSWSEGSMESFLEAAWAAKEFCGYEEDKLESDIERFYEEFYGYSLSEHPDVLKKILNGSYATN